VLLALAGGVALGLGPTARAQVRPYIGYAYPAGGQQGTTVQIRLGGQNLDGVNAVLITGTGVTARVLEYWRRLNNQEIQLLNEQLRELKRAASDTAAAPAAMMTADDAMMMSAPDQPTAAATGRHAAASNRIARIEKRTREFVQTPACAAIAALTMIEVKLAPDAEPGSRELRLVTSRGVSNPLVFQVGQLPEHSRKPMLTASLQVLGKEAQALRKRPPEEVEDRIALPCTVNGQLASGEVNRYRFAARQGQHLVIRTQARQLIPYIADAVPGWLQPVLALYDGAGKELAYADDYRFQPDPVLYYEVPKDGDYVVAIHDSLYRGREDFVYRLTLGELPFVTSIFPLGGRVGKPPQVQLRGWNLEAATLTLPPSNAAPGIHWLAALRRGVAANAVSFALDALPEYSERGGNHDQARAQKVQLPAIINGCLARSGEEDVFQFNARANDTVVAEVYARRLDSPLDSILRLTDAHGTVLAFNDDHADPAAGLHTHHADSYLLTTLPSNGTYFVHLRDTAGQGGEAFAYRLRLSPPRPDFALRLVPSSISLRPKSSANLTVYALRKDGYRGPITLTLREPPAGLSAPTVIMAGTQTVAKLTLRSDSATAPEPADLAIVGRAQLGSLEVTHQAVPAEDRMQAFLWRQLVPAQDLKVIVSEPPREPAATPVARTRPAGTSANLNSTNAAAGTNAPVLATAPKPKFTRQQIAGRLRQLRLLYAEGLLTDAFYDAKVAECE
jgi:hypothetical protein